MKYVITGGAGFIGSNLVDELVSQSHEVHVIDNFSFGKLKNCNKKAHYHNVDLSQISNFDQIKNICRNADSVFHLACIARVQPSIENPIEYEMNNTIGSVNILKASVQSNVRRFIYSSSSSVYGNQINLPLNEDFKTKLTKDDTAPKSFANRPKGEEFIKNMAIFGADLKFSLSKPAPLYIKPADAQPHTDKISIIK